MLIEFSKLHPAHLLHSSQAIPLLLSGLYVGLFFIVTTVVRFPTKVRKILKNANLISKFKEFEVKPNFHFNLGLEN